MAGAAGWKKADGTPFADHDFFPSLRPPGLPVSEAPPDPDPEPVGTTPETAGRTGLGAIEAGFDRWVQMCRSFAQGRGG